MLIGLPGSGKSTWVADYIANNSEMDFRVVSSDNIIEEKALIENLSYRASHEKNIGFAVDEMERRFRQYVKDGFNIIHDQTNLSKKARNKHLAKVKSYQKLAVLFLLEEELWRRRLETRRVKTGKYIPEYIIKNMTKSFEFPTKKEGFDKIISI
jgi:predicted kinase|tara:strand:- start:4 stop:465 length:462 start_codon:yes stop_codon:yes gene_type:complete